MTQEGRKNREKASRVGHVKRSHGARGAGGWGARRGGPGHRCPDPWYLDAAGPQGLKDPVPRQWWVRGGGRVGKGYFVGGGVGITSVYTRYPAANFAGS